MAGIFDLKKGAFDSSEAGRLYKAYDIALQGLRATHDVDPTVIHRLARSIVKVARTEADCLNNDGTIDPVRLAQRAILRMLQMSAPARSAAVPEDALVEKPRRRLRSGGEVDAATPAESPGRIMLKLFDRTHFAKL